MFKRKLKKLHSRFIDEAQYIISFDDCVKLDKIIRKNRVKNILEFGTGIGASTLSMAYSLPEDGHIDTVEQFKKCIEKSKKIVSEYPEYKEKISFHLSDVEIYEPFKYINTIAYREIPKGDYDLVVIDAPSFFMEGDYLVKDLPRGDIFRIFNILKNGTLIYIDGSVATQKLFRRFYSHCIERKNCLFKKIKSGRPQDKKLEAFKKWGFV